MKLISFFESVENHKMKAQKTSNIKVKEKLNQSRKDTITDMRSSEITKTVGFVNLHLIRGAHWIPEIKERFSNRSDGDHRKF